MHHCTVLSVAAKEKNTHLTNTSNCIWEISPSPTAALLVSLSKTFAASHMMTPERFIKKTLWKLWYVCKINRHFILDCGLWCTVSSGANNQFLSAAAHTYTHTHTQVLCAFKPPASFQSSHHWEQKAGSTLFQLLSGVGPASALHTLFVCVCVSASIGVCVGW